MMPLKLPKELSQNLIKNSKRPISVNRMLLKDIRKMCLMKKKLHQLLQEHLSKQTLKRKKKPLE